MAFMAAGTLTPPGIALLDENMPVSAPVVLMFLGIARADSENA